MHVLTCRKHLSMFLLSVKSLLRFKPNIAVVLHDDGSLTAADIRTLQHHIAGIRIIRRAESDMVFARAALKCPNSLAYRAQVINSLELTDHIMLGSGEKLIITNSDTLFLNRPDALLRWIDLPADEVLCVFESEPYQQAEYLARVKSDFPPHVTLGLVCFPRFEFDASEIEMLISQAGSSFDPWYLGQNTVPALLGRRFAHERVRFLDPDKYQASGVFGAGPIYRHYWSSLGVLNDQFFRDGASVIADLREAG